MTFEQFQATRLYSLDLAAAVLSDNWEPEGTRPTGYTYLDSLYIDEVQPHWPAEARAQGKWHLLIGNAEFISDDLTALERKLYEFAKSEEYID